MAGTLLMLANKYSDQSIAGWYASEKLDGQRCWWDGGISRGTLAHHVPWANIEKSGADRVCTGLWSRYGNIITAPDWWVDSLPKCPLDGELYCYGMPRQDIRSITSRHQPTAGGTSGGWNRLTYYVFDLPPFFKVLGARNISSVNYNIDLAGRNAYTWARKRIQEMGIYEPSPLDTYATTYRRLERLFADYSGSAYLLKQHILSDEGVKDPVLDTLLAHAEEGVMVRSPAARYECRRSPWLLKMKHTDDAEGIVVGYRAGRGKYLGMMGTVILCIAEDKTRHLEISGFTDYERTLSTEAGLWAADHPGERLPDGFNNDTSASLTFPLGTVITYRYRGLSKDGIPQEARYWRVRCGE